MQCKSSSNLLSNLMRQACVDFRQEARSKSQRYNTNKKQYSCLFDKSIGIAKRHAMQTRTESITRCPSNSPQPASLQPPSIADPAHLEAGKPDTSAAQGMHSAWPSDSCPALDHTLHFRSRFRTLVCCPSAGRTVELVGERLRMDLRLCGNSVGQGNCIVQRVGCTGVARRCCCSCCCRLDCMVHSEVALRQGSGGHKGLRPRCTGCKTAQEKVLGCSCSVRSRHLRCRWVRCSGAEPEILDGRIGSDSLLESRMNHYFEPAISGFFLALAVPAFRLLLRLQQRRQLTCWGHFRCSLVCPSRRRPSFLAQLPPRPRPARFARCSSSALRAAHPRLWVCCAHRTLHIAVARSMQGG